MEVTCGDYLVGVGEYGGVVCCAVNLGVDYALNILYCVFHGSVHLRYATEGVGILNVLLGLCCNLATLQESTDGARSCELTFMGTYEVYIVAERLQTAIEGVERQGSQQVGNATQTNCLLDSPYGVRTHKLSAVEQCQTLLGLECDRLPTLLGKHLGTTYHLAFVLHLAKTEQGEAEVSKRREVARSTE